MIRKGKDIPVQFLALLAGIAVDNLLTPALPQYAARFVPMRFQSHNDAYDMSLFLWANVNREKRCALCRKHFEYNEHFQHVFSVALDSESKIKSLHRVCAGTNSHVIIECFNYSDVMHELSVRWRGSPDRAVIGDTAELGPHVTSAQLLEAQKNAQDRAQITALLAEQQRRKEAGVIQ